MNTSIYSVKTPCYVVDEKKLIENLKILREIEQQSGCKILLAQKAFSMYALYPLIGKYLSGTTASGLFEAKLAAEEMGKENHVFSAAYLEEEIDEILHPLCNFKYGAKDVAPINLNVDISKIKTKYGWEPKISFKEGIALIAKE